MGFHHNPRVVTSDLVAYHDSANKVCYPRSGTTLFDLSGNDNDLVTAYSPTFSDQYGGIFTYDGTNDYATASSTGVSDCTDPFSIGIWVRIPSDATWTNGYFGTIVGSGGSYSGQYGLIRHSSIDNRIGFYVRGQTGSAGAYADITRDTWYYLTGVWSGTVAYLYVNSVKMSQSSGTLTGSWDSTNIVVALARAYSGAYGNYMKGDVGITQYYNRELEKSEIIQNYRAVKGRFGL